MRGRRYAVNGDQNIASPAATMLTLTGGTTIEPHVYHMSLGCHDTPADSALQWFIGRTTAAGTGTAVTPQNLGPGTTAATAAAAKNHTAEPTYTVNAILWRMALNQRASHTMILDPEGALVIPATANNGLGIYGAHASSTVDCDVTWHYME